MADYLAALPLGFILSFSFGPLFFILLETSISKGLKQAFFMDLGVAFSDFVLNYTKSESACPTSSNGSGLLAVLIALRDMYDKKNIFVETIN